MEQRLGPAAPVVRWAIVLSAVAFLNVFFGLRLEPSLSCLAPQPEVVALIVIFIALHAAKRAPHRWLPIVVAALAVPFRLLSLADEGMQAVFGRPLVLALDTPRFFDLLASMRVGIDMGTMYVGMIVSSFLLGVAVFTFKVCVGVVGVALADKRYWIGVPVMLAICALLSGATSGVWLQESALLRTTREIAVATRVSAIESETQATLTTASTRRDTSQAIARCEGLDVFLVSIASYGPETVIDADYRSALASARAKILEAAASRGMSVRSGWLAVPTVGGFPELTHASLASGAMIDSAPALATVHASDVTSLAERFARNNHRTVRVMPETTHPYPSGDFYGYAKTYYAWELGYQGPVVSWQAMPSEYVVDVIGQHELDRPRQPLFIELDLVSSRMPFREQPPNVDVLERREGTVYGRVPPVTFDVDLPSFEGGRAAHVRLMQYELGSVAELMMRLPALPTPEHGGRRRRAAGRVNGTLFVVFGTHPPPVGLNGNHDARTPLHVFMTELEADPFEGLTLSEGMIPSPSGASIPVASLF